MNDPYRPAVPIDFPRTNDEKNVRLLAVFHYVAAALTALLSCFFIIHIVMGVMMVRGQSPSASAGFVFIGVGSAAVLLGWTMAALLAYAGRSMAQRKRHTFCLVMAGLSCLFMPFGTALGIFSLVLLTKAPVPTMFGENTVARLEPTPSQTHSGPNAELPGWVSAEGKHRFTQRAALLLVGLVLSQMMLPLGFMAYTMGKALRTGWRLPELASAQQVGDRIWYIEREAKSHDSSAGAPARLASIRFDGDELPEAGPDLPPGSRFLAADGNALWAIGGEEVARYENGKVSTHPSGCTMYWPTPPFTYDNRPAVFDWRGSREIVMRQPDGDRWRDVPGESWKTSSSLARLPNTWAVLPAGSGFDVFMQFGSELRWRHIATGDPLDDPHVWELVSSSAGWWAATQVDGKSAIVQTVTRGPFDGRAQILQQTDRGWTTGWAVPAETFGAFAAVPLEAGKLRLVLRRTQGIETVDVSSSGSVLSRHLHANPGFPIAAFDYRLIFGLSLGTYFPAALVAAVLARMMRRHRRDVLTAAGTQVRFASLLQRMAARAIDQALVFAITLPWWWPWVRSPMTQAMSLQTMSPKSILVPLVGLAISCLAAFLLTSWMEGRWGVSPGKWALRIKVVGTDLAPCGFVRALIRNVLVMADGVLSFTLGMVFIAFSRNWQRIGDMAGRTVVVRSQAAPSS
jgi:uncharacterized RDD family membrane protein YckC